MKALGTIYQASEYMKCIHRKQLFLICT